MKHVSIILIPSFQPTETLNTIVLQLTEYDLRVIVIDDGSGKEYKSVFDSLPKSVTVLRHEINRGKGAALKTGYKFIKNNFESYVAITADGDGQHSVEDIHSMIDTYDVHPGSLLLGTRQFKDKTVPFRSRFGNTLTNKLFTLATKQRITDTQTGLRAFDHSLIDFMLSVDGERYEYELNVLLSAAKHTVPIVEHPIATIYLNNNQASHFRPIVDSARIYKSLARYVVITKNTFSKD